MAFRRGRRAQAWPAASQNRRLNHSPTDALIDLLVRCRLCSQAPIGLGRSIVTPYGQNIHPSQFSDQNYRVDSRRRQPRDQQLKPAQATAPPGERDQRPAFSPMEHALCRQVFRIF